MSGLQLGVGFVLGVAKAVVAQGHGFGDRIVQAAELGGGLCAIAVNAVFVEIVAQVDDRVEVGRLGERLIGVEIAELPVGAGHDGEFHRRVAGGGGGLCAAHGREDFAGGGHDGELVFVGLAGLKAASVDFHGVVARLGGLRDAEGMDGFGLVVLEDGVADLDRAGAAARRDARPENHAVAERVA